MAIMTPNEYLESLEKVKPKVYIHGELAEDLLKHPLLAPSLNSMKLTYAVSHRPEWQAKSTLLDGEPISLWTHPY
ncbi:MAG: 4-hydroxyphenylacetate 3-hydroxylase N-terminal domain-containing protein, partial [Actinomycetota bacterium]|nr:4-hydroxyphenylacetate 3-hydroxylase N-terminal domain-containing protein [Actinomycetota bacterium]